jgi:hypothetical protein
VEAVVLFPRVTSDFSSSFSSSGTVARRAVALALSLVALALLSACSNYNNTSSGVSCPGATGNFSNTSLPVGSNWTYYMSGFNYLTGFPFYEAGVFTVGSNGSVSGRDDYYASTFTGSFSISTNGTGAMTVNVGNGVGTLSWAITLTGAGTMYVMDADVNANSAGTAYQQDPTALSVTPSGTFVFRTHVTTTGVSLGGSKATVGLMTWAAGAITGEEDVLLGGSVLANGGSLSPPTAFTSVSVAAPDSTGTGNIQLSDGTQYNYYIIDANTMLLFDGNAGFGRAEMQSGTFDVNSLPAGAGYVFGSQGDSSATIAIGAPGGGANSVGQFTVDGNGNINSGGTLDAVRDGTVAALTMNAGTYVPDATVNGRYLFNLGTSGVSVQEAVYMVNSSRGFFVVANDATRVEDGTIEQQQAASFIGSDLNGQFAFVMGGLILPSTSTSGELLDRSGTVTSDGNGNLGWAEVANANGSVTTPGCLAGTYTVSANGRGTAQVPGLPAGLVFYMASSGRVYLLQNDSAVQISGGMVLQATTVVDPPGTFVKKGAGH